MGRHDIDLMLPPSVMATITDGHQSLKIPRNRTRYSPRSFNTHLSSTFPVLISHHPVHIRRHTHPDVPLNITILVFSRPFHSHRHAHTRDTILTCHSLSVMAAWATRGRSLNPPQVTHERAPKTCDSSPLSRFCMTTSDTHQRHPIRSNSPPREHG